MRDFRSRTAIGFQDRTEEMSPIGDISWTRNALDSLTAIEREASKGKEYGDLVHTDPAEHSEGHWFISFNSFIDPNSTSLRFNNVDTLLTWLVDKVVAGEPVASKTTFRFRFTDSFASRKSSQIAEEIANLFSLATFIDLEPGMTNEFQEGLEEVVERYGAPALSAVESLILNEEIKSSIAMEALQYIGDTDSSRWHDERRTMLERCLLESQSAWVRDGAGLGLASLDDPRSIPKIEEAISYTTSQALREDLTLVLDQLNDTLLESQLL